MTKADDIWFVYDGECPICQLGASFYKVRQSVGHLHTVDARTERDHPVMREVNRAGLDLDEGMVVKYKERLYQGEEALHLMATLGADSGILNKLNNFLFRSKKLAGLCYPSMKKARALALKLKGVGKIGNLKFPEK
jgi:predicted DCC family thiol-disulfide oxidoreductase YuxK